MTAGVGAVRASERLGWGPSRVGAVPAAAHLLDQATREGELPDVEPFALIDSTDQRFRGASQKQLSAQMTNLVIGWLDRMVTSRSPFVEKMTWFWHGYFATASSKVRSAEMLATQNDTQRRLATGSFFDLVQAMTVDPAMLVWLDGRMNRNGSPNENLGRELMELFVLGVGNYTEDDVKQAARALTGWTVDLDAATASFLPRRAEPGTKTVLGGTVADARSLVSMLVARPESARFVAGRVWSRFVAARPPSEDEMERLITAFGERRDVHALMTAVAAEPAFTDSESVLVKQPVEWAVGMMRALGVRPALLPETYRTSIECTLTALGQVPFEPPSVGGWPSGGGWLTTSAALERRELASVVALNADLTPIERTATGDRPDAALDLLGIVDPTERTRSALRLADSDPLTLVVTAACAPEFVVSR